MAAARNYRRELLMLYQQDTGFGIDADKKPAGFIKLEIKGSTGVLTALVQNLKDIKEEGLVYKGFMASIGEKPVFVNTGTIPVDSRGNGESSWRFDPENIDNSGYGIDKFNVFGIMVCSFEGGEQEFVCPLAGHSGKLPKDWKKMLQNRDGNKTVGVHELVDYELPEATHEAVPEAASEVVPETVPQAVPEKGSERVTQDLTRQPEAFEQMTDPQTLQEQQKQQKQASKSECPANYQLEGYFQEVLKFYPRVQPFEYPVEGCQWRRINSYNYLFGIMYDPDGRIKYYTYGIPGMYDTQVHKQMAAYGFSQWRPQRGWGYTRGECGYWLAFVDAKTGALAEP